MTPDELIATYPTLHHMAERGSWPSIQAAGLQTTEQLVAACNPDAATRAAILTQRRPHSYDLKHPDTGTVTIRDQKPLRMHNLLNKLDGITPAQFLTMLNDRVFLWTSRERLTRLLNAAAYRGMEHDVITFDTRKVIDAMGDRVRLAGMNTGSTIFPNTPKRGADTFTTIADFPFDERSRAKRAVDNVVELCVLDGIADVSGLVTVVERYKGPIVIDTLFVA